MEKMIEELIADLEVMEPITHNNITLFGLRRKKAASGLEYLLLSEAIEHNLATVSEQSTTGSVPEVTIDNQSDSNILLVDGEEVLGAKQNRIINSTMLVPGKNKQKIPVSCVEQGRWAYSSSSFTCGSVSHIALRQKKSSSVTHNLSMTQTYHSNQGEVWEEISNKASSMKSYSATSSLHDIYDDHRNKLEDYKQAFADLQGVHGFLVAINGIPQCADIFDKPATMDKIKSRLFEGYALDAIENEVQDSKPLSVADARNFLNKIVCSKIASYKSPGLGDDLRMQSNDITGSTLTYHDEIVHLAIFNNATISKNRRH